MRHLDLFSGIGGFALAASWVWGNEYENVGHSEIERFPCKVYHKHFPESRCLGDITKIEWHEGQADLITGGFPCQPHSIAGKRKASADSRDLWSECVRALRGVRPQYALFENVPGLLISEGGGFFNRVLSDLVQVGYDAEWQIVSAREVGAPHLRERIWIVAYPQGKRNNGWGIYRNCKIREWVVFSGKQDNGNAIRGETCTDNAETPRNTFTDTDKDGGRCRADSSGDILPRAIATHKVKSRHRGTGETIRTDSNVANPDSARLPGRQEVGNVEGEQVESKAWNHIYLGHTYRDWNQSWIKVATEFCRMDARVPNRVDRLKGLGNAIVPQVAQVIMQAIKDCDFSEVK